MSAMGSGLRFCARRTTDFCAGAANTSPISGFRARAKSPSCAARWHTGASATCTFPHAQERGFHREDLADVKPIRAATALSGFKHSSEPILALDKVRYVGELVAICVAGSRAQAEDIAASVVVDYEELEPVVDMLAARRPDAPLVHEEWGDNVFIEFFQDGAIDRVAETAAIKVTREIRTARHCMFPMEGRGVVAYWDARLGFLTVVSATQMPHIVQRGVAECLGLNDGSIRVISPDVGGGFGYKGLLCREEVALAWLAMRGGTPVRWLEDCREHLSANANCREHHYRITGYADRDGRLLALDCVANVDAGAYSVYPTSSALEAAQVASLLPGPYDFGLYRCRSAAVATNKCPILPYRGVARTGVCLAVEVIMDAIAREAGIEPYEARLRNLVASRADAVRERGQEAIRRRRLPGIHAPCGCGNRAVRRPRAAAQRRAGRAVDRRRIFDVLRARRDGNRRAGRLGASGRAGVRASDRAADGGWGPRDSRRHPFARPGPRNHAGPGGARDPRHRFRSHQGAAGRHPLQPVLHREPGLRGRS